MGEQLIVTIGAKDTASTAIKKVNNELKYLDKEYNLAKKSSKDFESSQDGLQNKLEYLNKKYDANKIKLEAYKSQLDKSKESIAKKEAELEKLKNAEGDNTVAIEKAEKQLEKYKEQMDKAAKNIKITELEMNNLSSEIDDTSKSLNNFKAEKLKADMEEVAQAAEKTGEKIKNVGNNISNVGGVITKISAGAIAGGVALGAMANNTQNAFDKLQGQLGLTKKETEELRAVALSVYENGFGESIEDCANSLVYLQQNLSSTKNWSDQTKQSVLEQIMTINSLFDTETSELTKTLSVMQNSGLIDDIQYGLDIITRGFQEGGDYSGELLDTLTEYSPQFVKLGLSADEALNYLITGAENGAFNLDKVGDAMKEFSVRAIDGSNTTIEGFKAIGMNADEMAKKFAAGGESAKGSFKEVIQAITAMDDPVKQSIVGVNLFGTMWEDLGPQVIASLGTVEGGLNDIEGATKRAGEGINNNFTAQFNSALRELKNDLLPLGIDIMKLAKDSIPALKEEIGTVTKFLGGMDDKTKQTVMKVVLFSAVLGPATIGVGKLTSGIGSLVGGSGNAIRKFTEFAAKAKTVESVSTAASVGGVGKLGTAIAGVGTATTGATSGASALSGGLSTLGGIALPLAATVAALGGAFYVAHEYNDLMSSSVLKSKDEMSAMEIILGRLTGATLHSKEEMEKMGYVYEEWNNNVSPETQECLDSIAEKSRNLQLAIDSVNFDGVITKEDINAVKTKTDEWCNSIIEVINNNKSEINESIEGLFGADGIVTEQEQKVLDILNNSNDEKKKIVEESAAKIKEINERASKENREISRAEQAVIKGEIIKANKAVLDSMNISSEEKLAAQNLFFEKSNAHSARALSESILQEKTARDEQIAVIKEKYDAGIQALKSKIPELKGLEKEQAEAELQNQIEQRDLLIQNENEKWNGIIGACEEKYPQYMDKINKYTGEEMSFWDKRKNERFQSEIVKYDEINKITEDGMYRLYNTESKTWENLVIKTDEATGEIIALNKLNVSERGIGRDSVVGYSKDICNQMDEEVKNAIKNRSIMTSIMNGYTKATVDSNGNILGSNNKVIASLDNMTVAADGTRQGFININGTPVKVTTNADGTIKNLKDIKTAIDNIPLTKSVTLTVVEQRRMVGASDGVDRYYADGTNYAQPGLAYVAEEGQELIITKDKAILTDNSGPQLFNFSGGEKVLTAAQTRNVLTSGSYYNADSMASRELINSTTNNYNTYNSSNKAGVIDYDVMAQTVAQAVAQAMQSVSLTGSVKLDDSSIVGKVSNGFAIAGKRVR